MSVINLVSKTDPERHYDTERNIELLERNFKRIRIEMMVGPHRGYYYSLKSWKYVSFTI